MISMIRMEFSRFFTNKMMYILLVVFMAFQMFGAFMNAQFETISPISGQNVVDITQSEYMQMILAQSPSWVMLYIGIFTVSFYMSEYNNGFHKNFISMENARVHTVIAKLLVLGMFTLLMFVIMIFTDFVGRAIFFENTNIGDPLNFIKIIVGQFLLHWAFVAVVLCITMIVRRMVANIVITVLLALNVIGMLLSALESLIHDGSITSYLLINTITSPMDYNNTGDFLHVIIVALVYFAVATAIAVRFKQKEDLH
ncbi:MAG TPA: ABC transporter permease [Aliicoccus persicus]|uniref:ABC transporter permease n=1 Tax=Aliicoccus persicus TaxID=930138 RepID=A0A921DXZ7_9STAP|nr:ABC transporter permease [Aliicoccus persicus]